MKYPRAETSPPSSCGRGSIRADEILTLREFGRRLGLGPRALCDAQRAGLRAPTIGRTKFVIGADAIEWVRAIADRDASEEARP